MIGRCSQCGRFYDPVTEGKVRRAEAFCSIRCADEAHPDMASIFRPEDDAVSMEILGWLVVLFIVAAIALIGA